MNNVKTLQLTVVLIAAFFWGCAGISAACSAAKGTSKKEGRNAQFEIIATINPSNKDWVKEQLTQGRSLLLTNSYLFQVMKGVAQENQKKTEDQVLIPLLKHTLEQLINVSTHADTRRLFTVALVLLSDDATVGRDEEITRQADIVKQNSMFNPRGHYTDSEALQRYFRSMQYLAKATIDVAIKSDRFPYPKEMLFSFDTAESVRQLLADPANEKVIREWKLIHSFYSNVNGPPDYPTFVDLEGIAKGAKLSTQVVKEWAEARNIPKINPERGLGIQPLGERTSLHQEVIDGVKEKFIKDDTPREEMGQILRFENLLNGVTRGQNSVKGLAERVNSEKGDSYYASALNAVALGADGWKRNPMRLNLFAASMTSLAEQTALMAKTSILVRKSAVVEKKIPENLKLRFEPGSDKYLAALAEASARLMRICKKTAEESSRQSAKDLGLIDMGSTFRALADLARKHGTLVTRGPLWRAHGPGLMELARKPAVTVDVFQVKDRNGKVNYYQWAIAPFEAAYPLGRTTRKTQGMEMVFFEAWADEMVTGHEGPLNNILWEGRILEGNLGVLPSIVKVPK